MSGQSSQDGNDLEIPFPRSQLPSARARVALEERLSDATPMPGTVPVRNPTMEESATGAVSPWHQLSATASQLSRGTSTRISTGTVTNMLDSLFDTARDASRFNSATKGKVLSLLETHRWLNDHEDSKATITSIVTAAEADMGEAIQRYSDGLLTLGATHYLGEMFSMALMIRMLVTDSRSPRRETLIVLLEYYVQLQDFETKVFLEAASDKTSFDQATVKELAGLTKEFPVWQSPGAMRLHPMSPRALEAWRELWWTICRGTLHRDVDLAELEARIEKLPCTSYDHFTKRKKGCLL